MYSIKIKNKEIPELLDAAIPEFPKYVTQILNLANQNAQGTRPKIVGQMSELVSKSNSRSLKDWEEWYSANYPNAIKEATQRVWAMVEQLKEAILKIDSKMVERWVGDLVIAKTFFGIRFQEAILKKVAEYFKLSYKLSTPEEEAQGIDGWIGNTPISIKPDTYKTMKNLPESIGIAMIYYSKEKDGIRIEADEFIKI
jgi:hypothetical protein